jgi:hypothetical protein
LEFLIREALETQCFQGFPPLWCEKSAKNKIAKLKNKIAELCIKRKEKKRNKIKKENNKRKMR